MDSLILGRVWSFRDITEQMRTDKALRKERILFRTIIDNLPDAIYAKDIEFRKTLANPTDLKNMGCTTESEVIGKTDFDFFHPESVMALSLNKSHRQLLENEIQNLSPNMWLN